MKQKTKTARRKARRTQRGEAREQAALAFARINEEGQTMVHHVFHAPSGKLRGEQPESIGLPAQVFINAEEPVNGRQHFLNCVVNVTGTPRVSLMLSRE